ncbi:MAG: hypothetical protein ACRBDL_01205 [Alphaproteobacteria bacterium]
MTFYMQAHNQDDNYIAVDNLDYVEDKLIELCDYLQSGGVHGLEVASGLLFTAHYILTRESEHNAQKYYRYLLKQCREQLNALPELVETAKAQEEKQYA